MRQRAGTGALLRCSMRIVAWRRCAEGNRDAGRRDTAKKNIKNALIWGVRI